MEHTLFISDLDGTLLSQNATLGAQAKNRLNRLIGGGVQFTIATARALPAIQHIFDGVGLNLPLIEQNGALVRDVPSYGIVDAAPIDRALVAQVVALFERGGLAPIVSWLDGSLNLLDYVRLETDGMRWYIEEKIGQGDTRLCHVRSHGMTEGRHCLGFTYLCDAATANWLCKHSTELSPQLMVVKHRNQYVDAWEVNISAHDAAKGHALRKLRARLPEQTRVIAFGDNNNDISLFAAADHCVAVSNGTEDLKRLAHEVIGDSESDAVLKYIESRCSWLGSSE